jgi:hypothetical protein
MNHDTDFNLWATHQVNLLHNKQFSELDIENLVDEIESMSKSDKRALKSYLIVIMTHLLKLNAQPHYINRASWLRSIRAAQAEIELIVEDSPSLKQLVPNFIESGYPKSVKTAQFETGLTNFPDVCPFDEQILSVNPIP